MRRHDAKVMGFLAYKNLTKSKVMFAVIVLVMAMSFLSITFFAAVIDGLGYEFEEGMIDGLTGHLLIEPKDGEVRIENADDLTADIARIPGVQGAAPRLESSAVAIHGSVELGAVILFIEPDKEREVSSFSKSMIDGEFLTRASKEQVLIGADLLDDYAAPDDTERRLDLRAGDTLTLAYSNGEVREYEVKGIFKTGSRFSDDKILVPRAEHQSVFQEENVASKILVKLPRRGLEEHYERELRAIGVSEEINSWETRMGAVNQFVGSLQVTNQIIGVTGLITGFATIYIIIFINVTNKRKQIGILKAIGIKRTTIMGSYVLQSLAYGVVGVIVGNLAMQAVLSILTAYPLQMPIGDVVPRLGVERLAATSAALVVASVIAGFFPSRKAANDDILGAIFSG